MSIWTRWIWIREYFCNKNIFSNFFRQLKILFDKIMVKPWKFETLAIYIFVQHIFLNNMVFFNYFYLHFYVSFILERRQVGFFHFKNFKNEKKIEKILGLQNFLQIRNPLGLMNIFHLLNLKFETTKISKFFWFF